MNTSALESEFRTCHLNLLVLAQLQQGYRVFSAGGEFKVQAQSVWDPLVRWNAKETRKSNLAAIKSKLDATYVLVDALSSIIYSYVKSCGGGVLPHPAASAAASCSSSSSAKKNTSPLISGGGAVHSFSRTACTSENPCYHDKQNIVLPVKYLRMLYKALHVCAGGDNGDKGVVTLAATYKDDVGLYAEVQQIVMIMQEKVEQIENILNMCDENQDLFAGLF